MRWGRRLREADLGTAALLLVLVWLVSCLPWLVSEQVIPWDSKDQFYPALRFASESLRSGQLPFWNPFVYGGYPSVSDPQSMLFSPLAMALMVSAETPSIHWFDAIELLHLLMGGIGMLLVSVRFGLSPVAGLYAGLVYMFGGPAAGRLQHVPMIYAYGYFPFALMALDAMMESRRVRWAVGFGVIAGVVAAHQNQVAYLFSLVLLGYAIHRVLSSDSPRQFLTVRLGVFSAAAFSGLLTLAVPLYATLQFLPLTSRDQIPLDAAALNALHPLSWITLMSHDFFSHTDPAAYWGLGDLTTTYLYAGALPLVLLVRYGVVTGVLLDKRFRFFAGVGVLGLLYSLGNLTPFYSIVYHVIPGVSLYRRPSDASFVINMVLALATAFLIDRLLVRGKAPVRPVLAVITVGVMIALLLGGALHALRQPAPIDVVPAVLSAVLWTAISWCVLAALIRIVSARMRWLVVYAGLGLLAADLGVHSLGQRFNAEADAPFALLEPSPAEDSLLSFVREGLDATEGPYRAEFVLAGSLWSNAPMLFGIESSQGYNPLRYRLYERVVGAQDIHSSPRPFPPMLPTYDSPMLDLLGVRYIVSSVDPGLGPARFPLVRDEEPRIWENTDPLPRVVVAREVYLEPDLDRAIDEGRLAPLDYRHTVVLDHRPETLEAPEGSGRGMQPGRSGAARARITAYTNTTVEVSVDADRDAILVLHDLYYPYWRVWVDDQESELLRANYAFRGVYVPAGQHEVVFRFQPFSLTAVRATIGNYFLTEHEESRNTPDRVTANSIPNGVSVRPRRGSGSNGQFVFTFGDPDGFEDLSRVTILFNTTRSGEDACYLYFEGNSVQLSENDGSTWQAPVTLGSASTLENSQCQVDARRSTVSGSGDILTLTLDLTFFERFGGIHTIWAYAEDAAGNSASQRVGSWALWREPPTILERLKLLLAIPQR